MHGRYNGANRWNHRDLLAITLLGLGVFWAMHRFWQPGIASDADMLMAIYRIFDLHDAWQRGVFYPRISPNLNFGYGAPLFQYYPPLASYVAMLFVVPGIGYIEAAKATFMLATVVATLGVYSYGRWLFNNQTAAWLSAVTFLFSPYFLLNVYERGALSETIGLALLPWMFLFLHKLLYQSSIAIFFGASVTVSLSILAHNVTALFVVPAAGLFIILIAIFEQQPRRMLLPIMAIVTGLGLSAFYWLPAIGELGYSRATDFMIGDVGASTVSQHLVEPATLLQWSLVTEYAGPARFRFSGLQALIATIGVIALSFQTKLIRRAIIALWLLAAILVIVLLLQLGWFRFFWDGLPLIRFIQFSWRLFGLASFAASILIGSLVCLSFGSLRWPRLLAVTVSLLLIVSSTTRLSPDMLPGWYQIDSSQISKLEMFERGKNGYALFTDYTPSSLQLPAEELSLPRSASESSLPSVQPPQLSIRQLRPDYFELISESSSAYPLRIHRTYFPGWQALVDGQEVETFPSGAPAVVTAIIPAGQHQVIFEFGDTLLRLVAVSISMVAVLGMIVVISIHLFRQRRLALLAVFVLAIGIIGGSPLIIANWREMDVQKQQISFGDQIYLLGYRPSNSSFIRPGETITLELFWWIPETPPADYTVFLHLTQADDDSVKIAQIDKQPMMGYSAMTRWESSEIVDDFYTIQAPLDAPPGEYALLLGAYNPNTLQNLPLKGTGDILPGDRLRVMQFRIE